MRLIDADALSARMYHDAFETDSDMQKWDSGCWIRYKMFENAIEDAPAIKPERKTGRWIVGANHGLDVKTLTCSECGYVEVSSHILNFCSNCGAYMRGEQNG